MKCDISAVRGQPSAAHLFPFPSASSPTENPCKLEKNRKPIRPLTKITSPIPSRFTLRGTNDTVCFCGVIVCLACLCLGPRRVGHDRKRTATSSQHEPARGAAKMHDVRDRAHARGRSDRGRLLLDDVTRAVRCLVYWKDCHRALICPSCPLSIAVRCTFFCAPNVLFFTWSGGTTY